MKFKTDKIEGEFFKIQPKLRLMLAEADWFLWKRKGEAFVTSLFREPEEQRALYQAGQASSTQSVHMYGRGADLRVTEPEKDIEDLANYLNEKYPYDPGRPKFSTALIHEGTRKHLHIQVKE